MADSKTFRVTDEDCEFIERIKKFHGFPSDSDAIKYALKNEAEFCKFVEVMG
ncbi:hypothetical protein [Methanococcus maripaludis]|jgi:Arc/MetJ-type ribon-helix-helix transcriptional regulator|uniref:Uncharacterized protein n=1 Tax=Methanococcus maripaludis TaxID=39152 RepID=A0A8T3VYH9_METMI|nr:hypothetical protein [Methanococcus maripaludis]MBG0769688.1 hypothetical protein [Methanococcus maripaludis]